MPNCSSCKLVTQTSNTKGSNLFFLACLLLETQPNTSFRIYLKPPITSPSSCYLVCQIFTAELKGPQDIGLCNGNDDSALPMWTVSSCTKQTMSFTQGLVLQCEPPLGHGRKGSGSIAARVYKFTIFLKNTLRVWSDFSSGTTQQCPNYCIVLFNTHSTSVAHSWYEARYHTPRVTVCPAAGADAGHWPHRTTRH